MFMLPPRETSVCLRKVFLVKFLERSFIAHLAKVAKACSQFQPNTDGPAQIEAPRIFILRAGIAGLQVFRQQAVRHVLVTNRPKETAD
jgi:hypothetical protein